MDILIGILIVVEVLVSFLLIAIILIQPSKSGGLGGALGGGGGQIGEQLFGARTGNVLTKGTVIFATVFLLNTLALAYLYSLKSADTGLPSPGPVLTAREAEDAGMDASAVEEAVEPEAALQPMTEEDAPDSPGQGVLAEEPETAGETETTD